MEKKTNYGKIFAIIAGVVVGVCAVAFFVSKLIEKYFVLKDTEYNDLMETDEESDELAVHPADEEAEEAAAEEAAVEEALADEA